MAGWLDLGLQVGPAAELVAGGAPLLEAVDADGRPRLRWYRSTDTALVLGRGQQAPPGARLPVLVRSTGGGAVLMSRDLLSLDVVLPYGHPWLQGDLSSVFLPVGRAWARALESLGVPDLAVHSGPAEARRRGSTREQLLAAVCYATLGRGEVTAGGRKLVGLAQRRRRAGALIQCGLLRRWDPGPLLADLGADPHDQDIAARAIGLDDLMFPSLSDETVMETVGVELAG